MILEALKGTRRGLYRKENRRLVRGGAADHVYDSSRSFPSEPPVVRTKRLTPLPVTALLEAIEDCSENRQSNQGGTA